MLYRLKRTHGVYLQLVKSGASVTSNYETGANTSTTTIYEIERAIVTPVQTVRDYLSQTAGVVYDLKDIAVIIDRKDLPSGLKIDTNDYVYYDDKKWQIGATDQSIDGRSVVLILKSLPNLFSDKIRSATSGFLLTQTATAEI